MDGRTVGQYQIQEELGSGGMGVVFKALDTKLGRTVALKFLPPHLSSDPSAKERFMLEARAASALDHANICTIHDIGEDDDGKLFIVMSFYEGETLKSRLDEAVIGAEEAITIAFQITKGLAASHEAGIVHRDIKPANIMVTKKGDVKILDFGVAKLSESKDLTQSGATVGTASYMSPEQARGEQVDHRADIWAVGVLLYEMLSGQRPFEGGYEAAMVYAIINQDPPALSPDLPDGLEAIVRRCLAKNLADRFGDASTLGTALEPFISSSGQRAIELPLDVSGFKPAPQSLLKVAFVFSLVSVVVLGLFYGGMIFFGLPDWVFLSGVILMMIGLPVLLYAAFNEQQEAGLAWLSVRRASLGGVLSMSSLAVFSAVFMVLRAMGIGPAATLVTAGALEENAQLIVAEFDNRTQDETLATSVTEALKIDLSQSTAIQLMDGSSIVEVLTRMGRDQSTRIDLNTAMEIATREGAEGVVSGEISPVGRGFVLSARLLGAGDGAELIAIRENAKDDGELIDAIDRLSKRLREGIGESMKTIRANKNLDYVSTRSLEALRMYSEAVTVADLGELERSRDLLLQAIALDSTFAMAYRKLAITYSNLLAPFNLEVDAVTKAYVLRDHLPERERWSATALYYARIERDNDRERAAYESLLEKYPDELPALNNLALLHNLRGEPDKAVPYLLRALEIADRPSFYDNLLDSYSLLHDWEAVDALLDRFDKANASNPVRHYFRFIEALASDQYENADTLLKATTLTDSPGWRASEELLRGRYFGLRGRFAEAEKALKASAEVELERGSPDQALRHFFDIAFNYLDRENNIEKARTVLEEGLRLVPLNSIPPVSRPYSRLIELSARLGELDQARAYLAEYETVVEPEIRQSDFGRWIARATIQEMDGDFPGALETLKKVRTVDHCGVCPTPYYEARILERMDSTDAAIRAYDAFRNNTWAAAPNFFGEEKPVTYFRLGELYSLRGDTDDAIEAYSKFVAYWKDADAIVQPQVNYARERIDALLQQAARERG